MNEEELQFLALKIKISIRNAFVCLHCFAFYVISYLCIIWGKKDALVWLWCAWELMRQPPDRKDTEWNSLCVVAFYVLCSIMSKINLFPVCLPGLLLNWKINSKTISVSFLWNVILSGLETEFIGCKYLLSTSTLF